MSFYQTLLQEFKAVMSDTAILLTIIGGVVLYSFLYPQPYSLQSVSGLRVSVVDYDKSDLSREIIYMLDATPQVDVVREDTSDAIAKDALLQGDIKAIVVIPHHFKKDVMLKKSPTIALGADASYFLIYGGVVEAAMKSVLTEGVKLKVASLLAQGKSMQGAKKEFAPFVFQVINFFNPNNSYTQYVIPAVFVLILQQTMLIGLGILGGGINERYYKNYNYNAPVTYVILSRAVIFLLLFFFHLIFYFGFSFEFFSIIHLATMSTLLVFSSLFLVATFFFGLFIGSLFNTREIATPTVVLSSLPLVFSAGFVWPLEMVPEWIKILSNLFPSTPAIQGFLQLNQMGASLEMLHSHVIILLLQTIIYAILGYYILNRKRKSVGKI